MRKQDIILHLGDQAILYPNKLRYDLNGKSCNKQFLYPPNQGPHPRQIVLNKVFWAKCKVSHKYKMTEYYNDGHILRLLDTLPNFFFTTSEI